jgi:methylated-DNA-[protein]-cysteine S-methyltransferase
MLYTYAQLPDPLRDLLLLSDDETTLHGLYFADQQHAPTIPANWINKPNTQIFTTTVEQLEQFVQGKHREFTIPYGFIHGTDFQKKVWRNLAEITYGTTSSYLDVALLLSSPHAARAIGAVVARNPISIIVPCHRVIGKNGKLTGYAGGINRKKALLDLEKNW